MGLFAAPNRAGIMNSLPPDERAGGGGMATTFQNAAQVLSIGIYFSLVVIGLTATAAGRPSTTGLASHGVPHADAAKVSHLPPVGTLFAAFLGYNPMGTLLGAGAARSSRTHTAAYLTGHSVLPDAGLTPVRDRGSTTAFYFAAGCCVVAAIASWLRGGKYYHVESAEPELAPADLAATEAGGLTGTSVDIAALVGGDRE